jgi:hypothetical protein
MRRAQERGKQETCPLGPVAGAEREAVRRGAVAELTRRRRNHDDPTARRACGRRRS